MLSHQRANPGDQRFADAVDEFVACEQQMYFWSSLRRVKLETRAEKTGCSHRITNSKT